MDIDRAKRQAALREDAAIAEATPAPPRPELAGQLGEIFYKVILGGMAAANGNHAAAARHLEEAARQLTLAIARAKQIAASERLPRK